MTDKQDTKQPEKPKAVGYPASRDGRTEGVVVHGHVGVDDLVRVYADPGMDPIYGDARVTRVVARRGSKTHVLVDREPPEGWEGGPYLNPQGEIKAWGYRRPPRLRSIESREIEPYGDPYDPPEAIVPGHVEVGDFIGLFHEEGTYHLRDGIQDNRVDKVLWRKAITDRITLTCIQLGPSSLDKPEWDGPQRTSLEEDLAEMQR